MEMKYRMPFAMEEEAVRSILSKFAYYTETIAGCRYDPDEATIVLEADEPSPKALRVLDELVRAERGAKIFKPRVIRSRSDNLHFHDEMDRGPAEPAPEFDMRQAGAVELCARFDRIFAEIAGKYRAQLRQYPSLIQAETLQKCNYMSTFPQNLYAVSEFPHDIGVLRKVREQPSEYRQYARSSGYLLAPAVCFHCYDEFRDTVHDGPFAVTASGSCFRHEAAWRVGRHRQREFTMREIIFFGKEEEVEDMRHRMMMVVWELFLRLGLKGRIETANDPFYFNEDMEKAQFQMASHTKYELVAEINERHSFSLASFNHVRDSLCKSFNIRDASGEFLHSGCVAFGVERWVYAHAAQYGGIAAALHAWREAAPAPDAWREDGGAASTPAPGPDACEAFLRELNHALGAEYTAKMDALWKMLTSGEHRWLEVFERHEQAYQRILSSHGAQKKIRRWRDRKHPGLWTARELIVLDCEMLEYQGDRGLQNEIIRQWNELNAHIGAFRTEMDGTGLEDKEALVLFRVLKEEDKRKRLWHAYMRLGNTVAPRLVELVKNRNRLARAQGFEHYYAMKLASQEMDPLVIQQAIDRLLAELGPSYREVKRELDAELCERYGVDSASLRSWHYDHPFFQSCESQEWNQAIEWETFLPEIAGWLEERGCPIREIVERMDMSARKGKSAANFCLSIDRRRDIRVSCRVGADLKGAAIVLHELGHAIYDKHCDPKLPFLLRRPAHPFLSEAAALLMERLLYIPGWRQMLGKEGGVFVHSRETVNREMKKQMLVKLFWTITLVRFEQKLYEDPDQPLNRLWWDLVEEYQGIARPDQWDAPYWSCKPHLTTLPASYYNYLLGELAASQFQQVLNERFGAWHTQPALEHLKETVFRHGASKTWAELITLCTGKPFTAACLIDQLKTT